MTDYSKLERPPTACDLFNSSRKGFQQAIEIIESLNNPSKEVSNFIFICTCSLYTANFYAYFFLFPDKQARNLNKLGI